MPSVNCQDIGIKLTRDEFVEFLNSVGSGQFMAIKGYVDSTGEKSDFILRFGINYSTLKNRDADCLNGILEGKIPDKFPKKLFVEHGVWVNPAVFRSLWLDRSEADVERSIKVSSHCYVSEFSNTVITNDGYMAVDALMDITVVSNRKSKDRVYMTLQYELAWDHPLVIAAIGDKSAQGTLMQGLMNPRKPTAEYEKEGKSAYSMDKDGLHKWYLRDVLVVNKTVRVLGDRSQTASLPINGVKNAISKLLLTGNYRQFILTDGQFESITIDKQSILCDGIAEEFYMALPEHVSAEMEVHNG